MSGSHQGTILPLLGTNSQKVADAKCTYIQADSEYRMGHKALQPGLRWEGLLTPWIQEIMEALVEANPLGMMEERHPAPPEIQQRVEAVVDSYLRTHNDPASREELLKTALFPFEPA